MRKLNVLDTKYNNSGLHARIPALNNLTLLEFFEDNNILDYNDKAIYDGLVEAANESIAIGDKTITLYSTKKYFSGFDIVFETLPNTLPDTYRLWLVNQGVTDDISYSFIQGNNVMLGDIKSPNSNIGPNTLYLNLLNLNVGEAMKLTATNFNLIDVTDYDLNDEVIYYFYRMYRFLKDDTKKTGYTYLTKGACKYDVAYVNKTIDEVVYEGLTLRDIFEDGNLITNSDFSDGTNGWTISNANISAENNILTVDSPTSHVVNLSQNLASLNDFYSTQTYNAINIKSLNSNIDYIRLGIYINNPEFSSNLGIDNIEAPVLNEDYSLSFINDITVIGNLFFYTLRIYDEQQLFSGDITNIFSAFSIPMNIFTTVPTKEQMDEWRDQYLARKNITKKALTYADIFEEFELVENGDFNTNDGWSIGGVWSYNANGYVTYDDTGTGYFTRPFNIIEGTNYYLAVDISIPSGIAKFIVAKETGNYVLAADVNYFDFVNGFNSTIQNAFHSTSNPRFYSITATTQPFNVNRLSIINLKHFDELITKEQLDTMLAHYLLVKNIVIYPEIYVPVEPVGLGNRFKLLAVDDTVYGHELDFEDLSFKMYFGVNYDAYKGYNDLMNMLKNNKAIIQYDWGIGPRYNDVRLLNAPKTEKDTSLLIISKFYFKRLNPFYELIEVSDEENMKNESDLDSPVKLDLTVNDTTVSIKLLDASSGVQKWISFDFTGVSTPFNLTIDPETKKLLIDGMTDAYDYADHTKDSFIYLPGDSEIYSINITGASVNKITYKKWVIS